MLSSAAGIPSVSKLSQTRLAPQAIYGRDLRKEPEHKISANV
jgi:hypothetical protein